MSIKEKIERIFRPARHNQNIRIARMESDVNEMKAELQRQINEIKKKIRKIRV